ncbi:BZ3500_MvSof-1268-A1-R1_Chr6-3g09026 [Microbotryum saponariae]|uniref:BZ3500_MvSof-1268-A1-R1_Chr6-3g09026 protein n=1 Tax=Microbotryum saponariae TaxID=289078 RepID=A0A2X0KKA3_9BASI|nr:BZ3500_MvSof-1268-A1-R1_Chr6-3g09026 [Microbotryum saponariae]SDA07628.1 BZ3501_MvSof-1269-A2-R1_Chr6-2g08730 [Microbotryum saponariae]
MIGRQWSVILVRSKRSDSTGALTTSLIALAISFIAASVPSFLVGWRMLASYFEGVARKYLSIAFERRGLPIWAKSCCSLSAAVTVIDTTGLDLIGLERGKASSRSDMPDRPTASRERPRCVGSDWVAAGAGGASWRKCRRANSQAWRAISAVDAHRFRGVGAGLSWVLARLRRTSTSADPQLPSTSDTYDQAPRGTRFTAGTRFPAGHDSDYSDRKCAQERDRKLGVGPSTSAASAERATARAERIFQAVQMHQKHCPALEAYFFGHPTAEELANKIWPKQSNIGTEEALGEVIADVINQTGDRRLVACKNSTQYISVAPNRVKTTDKTADVVLLTHAAVAHDPTLPNVWALPSHADPQAKEAAPDADLDTNVNGTGKGQHQNDEAEAVDADNDGYDKYDEDDNDDDDENKTEVKVDLNRAKRSFTHVAAVGETKTDNSNAESQLFRRLSALLATPIREYAIGFTLHGDRLKVYVMTSCGMFFTKHRTVTKENGELSTFLYRLLKHSDRLNGVLPTTTSLDDRYGPFTLCPDFFPPAASEFSGGATTMSNVKIEKLLFRRRRECGRATSTYEITLGEGANVRTRAMTITWVEQSRNSDLAEIRNLIQKKRPRGLAPLVGVFRTEYRTLPMFLPGDESLKGVTPRAREVVVHEECYNSLATLENTKQLARALEGAIEGHRQLWNHGFIHRDVSYGNVMVDQYGKGILIDYNLAVKKARTAEEECRLSRSGTRPYISRLLLSPATEGVVHERWHDIESFFYVASRTAFQSESAGPPLFEKPKAERIWNVWNAKDLDDAAGRKNGLSTEHGFEELLNACASHWSGVEKVLSVLQQNCSLDQSFARVRPINTEPELASLWNSGQMSYEHVQAALKALCE